MRRFPGVLAATIFGQSMHLLVEEGAPEHDIKARLANVGITHVDIRPIGPSLEDVFVTLTAHRNGAVNSK
jgi:hypothetical protein